MAYVCNRCGQTVDKIIALGDAEETAWITDTINVPAPQYEYVCITCAREILNITEEDLIREERRPANDTEFNLRLVKGQLAQVLMEIIFLEFGYEVYPFGYESYLTNIIRHMRKGTANIPARKVRATPDLFVYDREANDGFFIEVKATSTRDETHYCILKSTFDIYRAHWPEAFIVVYCIPSGNIYCRQISQISLELLPEEQSPYTEWINYVLNLERDFQTLPEQFRLVEPIRYEAFIPRLKDILASFGNVHP